MGAGHARPTTVTGAPVADGNKVFPLLCLYGKAHVVTFEVNACWAAGRVYSSPRQQKLHVWRWVMPHNMYTKEVVDFIEPPTNGDLPLLCVLECNTTNLVEVTEKVREVLFAGHPTFAVTNEAVGADPAYGSKKQLLVACVSCDASGASTVHNFSVWENDALDFTKFCKQSPAVLPLTAPPPPAGSLALTAPPPPAGSLALTAPPPPVEASAPAAPFTGAPPAVPPCPQGAAAAAAPSGAVEKWLPAESHRMCEEPGLTRAVAEALNVEQKVEAVGYGLAGALRWQGVSVNNEVATLVGGLTLEAAVGVNSGGAPVAVRVGLPGQSPKLQFRVAQ